RLLRVRFTACLKPGDKLAQVAKVIAERRWRDILFLLQIGGVVVQRLLGGCRKARFGRTLASSGWFKDHRSEVARALAEVTPRISGSSLPLTSVSGNTATLLQARKTAANKPAAGDRPDEALRGREGIEALDWL